MNNYHYKSSTSRESFSSLNNQGTVTSYLVSDESKLTRSNNKKLSSDMRLHERSSSRNQVHSFNNNSMNMFRID